MQVVDADATSRNRVYKQLRRAIIMGRRAPGERLSVDELCQTFGSGISPVRDALQMLGQEGLIEIEPALGLFRGERYAEGAARPARHARGARSGRCRASRGADHRAPAGGVSKRPQRVHGRRRRVLRPLHRREPSLPLCAGTGLGERRTGRKPRPAPRPPRSLHGHAPRRQHPTRNARPDRRKPAARGTSQPPARRCSTRSMDRAKRFWTGSCRAKARVADHRAQVARRAASSGLASHLSGVQALVRRFGDRLHHRPEVLHRRVQLDVMRRPQDQAATLAHRAQPRLHLRPHRLG